MSAWMFQFLSLMWTINISINITVLNDHVNEKLKHYNALILKSSSQYGGVAWSLWEVDVSNA